MATTTAAVGKVVEAGKGVVYNVLGQPTEARLQGGDTEGRLAVFHITCPPGLGVPPHLHTREDEVFHILEGRFVFEVNGRSVAATPGMTLLAPRNAVHAFRNDSGSPARMLVTVTPAGIERMFAELDQLPPGPPDMAQVTGICARAGIRFV